MNQKPKKTVTWSNDTYREPLCVADNKGYPLFSPLCNPNFVMPEMRNDQYQQRKLVSYGENEECQIPSVAQPKAEVPQYTDYESAHGWFKDPSYAQRATLRKLHMDETSLDTNPSLQLYHKLKTMERVAGSMMQSM